MAESEPCVSSCIGSSFELEGDLRCFGKPITVFFHVVSVAGRDYGFLRWPFDLASGLARDSALLRACEPRKNEKKLRCEGFKPHPSGIAKNLKVALK